MLVPFLTSPSNPCHYFITLYLGMTLMYIYQDAPYSSGTEDFQSLNETIHFFRQVVLPFILPKTGGAVREKILLPQISLQTSL